MIKQIFNFQFKTSPRYLFCRVFKSSRGFTILESIVAIFILSLSISGVFSAIQQSFSQANVSKDEIKAYYLAQEAIEIFRNKRDANQLTKIVAGSSNDWLFDISGNSSYPCHFGNTCTVDAFVYPSSNWAVRCSGSWGSCPNLRQDPNLLLYGYNFSWTATNFKREIQIEPVSLNEISVTVRVSWNKGPINREFKVKTHLFNWI